MPVEISFPVSGHLTMISLMMSPAFRLALRLQHNRRQAKAEGITAVLMKGIPERREKSATDYVFVGATAQVPTGLCFHSWHPRK